MDIRGYNGEWLPRCGEQVCSTTEYGGEFGGFVIEHYQNLLEY